MTEVMAVLPHEPGKWYQYAEELGTVHHYMFSGDEDNRFGGDVLSICFKKDFKHPMHLCITEPNPGHIYLAPPEDDEDSDFFCHHINIQEIFLECILDILKVEFVFISDIQGDTFQSGFTLQVAFHKVLAPPHKNGCIYRIYTGNIKYRF